MAAGPGGTPQPAPSTAQKAASLDVTKVLVVVEIDPTMPFSKSAAQDPALKDFGQANRGEQKSVEVEIPFPKNENGQLDKNLKEPRVSDVPFG